MRRKIYLSLPIFIRRWLDSRRPALRGRLKRYVVKKQDSDGFTDNMTPEESFSMEVRRAK